jgi:hypothetical protein
MSIPKGKTNDTVELVRSLATSGRKQTGRRYGPARAAREAARRA